jgi:hypothetical protein
MQEVLLISNVKPEQKSLDFELLREQGIENIQNLASKVWTDYNAHDPGITILEQLIYAITELGYKTNFDIKDIIAQNPAKDKQINTGLFTAPQILSNTPVHIDDFRKILIDVEGVRNAFVKIANRPEIPVFIDTVNKVASYTGEELVNIRGLYSAIIELDKDDEFGDLNSTVLDWSFVTTHGPSFIEIDVEVSFPDWIAVSQTMRELINASDSDSFPRISSIQLAEDEGFGQIERRTYGALLEVDIHMDAELTVKKVTLPINIIILDNIAKYDIAQIEEDLQSALNNDLLIGPLVLKYNKKMIKIWDIAYAAQAKLDSYRNLCEDFKDLGNLKVEEVGLCLQIEVGPGADIEQIEAEIYFRVGNFLSPKIKFHSATELLNRGMTVDQIFEGPVLDHGFLDLNEALTIDERKVLYVSDLIQIIMDIPGVISVADIHLSSYIDNVQMNEEVMDCLAPTFEETHRLRLSVQKSSTIFFRDDDPTDPQKVFLVASKKKVREKIRELEILESSLVIGNDPDEFDAPEGNFRDMEEYYSVQNTFPISYGIGPAGLNSELPALRYAQAKQLKSYLLFSEQLLANLLSQLSHIKELFAIDPTLKKTYFSQRVDIPNVFPTDAGTYEPYKNSEFFNYKLQDIIEGKELYTERRNKVLDHLLARFSEDFTTYSLKLFEVFGIGTEERLIKDKLNFLNNLPVVSGERLRSYNYKDEGNVWNTDNVPGYQKRVSLKLGIEDFTRKSLSFVFDERPDDIERVFRLYEAVDGNAPASPTTAVTEDAGDDTVAWTNLGAITQEGESSIPNEVRTGLMNEDQTSDYLYVTGFGASFSFVPSDAVIQGIKVEIVKRIDPETGNPEIGNHIDGDIEDYEIKIIRGGIIVGANRARIGEAWPVERRYFSYGGKTDLWGTTFSHADIIDTDLGVAIRVKKTGDRQRRANIDHVKMMVYYNLPVLPDGLSVTTSGTGVDWTDPEGVSEAGDSVITSTGDLILDNTNDFSKYLEVKGFDFSFIDDDAVIEGIVVEINKQKDSLEEGDGYGGEVRDHEIKILKAGDPSGDNKANTLLNWPASFTNVAYGGIDDNWGLNLKGSDVKDADFGLSIKVTKVGLLKRQAQIDEIKITLYYNTKYHFETQPESRSFGISSIAAGYDTEQQRKDILTDVVDYGYNFCNYCKEPSPYRIKKSLTEEDRDGMCEAEMYAIEDYNSGTGVVKINNQNLLGKLPVGKKVTLQNGTETFVGFVQSIDFVDGSPDYTEITLVEAVVPVDPLTTLLYDRIDTIEVVYSGSVSDSAKAAADLADLIFRTFWDFEGMHVVEHLLLRPKVNESHFVLMDSNVIKSTDSGRLRYFLKKRIDGVFGNLNYDDNKITVYGEDLTSFILVGKQVQILDEYGNFTVYTVTDIDLAGSDTVITTQEALERDGDPIRLVYERNFKISNFDESTNSAWVSGQLLHAEIQDFLLLLDINGNAETLVLEVYNSNHNNGSYMIDTHTAVVEEEGGTTFSFLYIQKPFVDDLLPIAISLDDCECPELKDNYSFRISVIMPEWPVRFKNGNFRKLAERILRYEAPAHVYVRLVWVDKLQMKAFEQKYKAWLEQTSLRVPDPEDQIASDTYKAALNITHDEFVQKLFALRNKFSGSVISDISSDTGSTGELSLLGQIYLG